ncbi:MAG TPA: tetratricopeptide repeat protein, partial [Pirellulales bacterium]
MIARTPISVIASAVGVLATCLVLTPLNGHLASAQTSDGSNVKAWFNRNGSAGGGQTVAANANQPTAGPLHKFSARVSSMGQSVKKAFTGSTQKPASNQPKADDDAITLSKPAQPRADFYLSLGRIQERAGNSTGAVEQYKRALELEPGNLAALMALARFYDRQGQLPDALKYYKQATVAHPQEAAAYNDQGLCYARQQQYPEAAACLRKAVELRADRVLYRNNLATVQVEMGQIDQAFQTLAPAHGAAIAHYNLGFLLNKRGETAQALQQFKLAAASDPSFEAARQWVDTLTTKLAGDPTGGGPVASRQPSAPVANPDLKR